MIVASDVLLKNKISEKLTRQFSAFVAIAGWVLIGTSLSTILFSSLPFQLLQPEFQLRLISAILSACMALLLGSLLVCGAYVLSLEDDVLLSRARLVRTGSRWFAILLVLIIPFQLVAGIRALGQVQAAESEMLKQRRQVIQRFSIIEDELNFRAYVASLPDRPQIPEKFDAPFAVIKKRAITNLTDQYRIAEAQLQPLRSQRWQRFFGEVARNSVQAVLMALAFRAIGVKKKSETASVDMYYSPET